MSHRKSIFNWQIYLGFVLVLTGGLFLADQLLGVDIMRFYWPLLIVLFGLTFFVGMLAAGKRGSGLAIPGAIITTLGLILFIQNMFNLWITWTYAWALIISGTGLGLLIFNVYHKQDSLRRIAGLIIGIGLFLFVFFGIFFEIILNIAGSDVNSGIFLGAGLVLLGLFIFFSRPLFARRRKKESQDKADVVDVNFEDMKSGPEAVESVKSLMTIKEDFSGLNFKSVGEVFIRQGDTPEVKVEGQQDIFNRINVEVYDGELRITYQADVSDWMGLRWVSGKHRLRYYLTVKNLEWIRLAGAGSIEADQLVGETISLAHSGVGSMKLRGLRYQTLDADLGGLGEILLEGEVTSQNVDLSGAGSYRGEGLKSQEANIALSGAGSVHVWVETALNAHLSGIGDIKYNGSPSIEQSQSGIGRIYPL